MQQWIILIVFLIFISLVISGKAKIHVAAMIIPIVFEITGVLTFQEAWSGLTNSSVVMMASMFVVAAGLNKTDLVSKLSRALIKPGSSDFKILLGLMVPLIFLSSVVNGTATMTIMIPITMQVCAEQKRPMSKFMYPLMVLGVWSGFIPTGGNAGSYLAQNTIVENLGGVGEFTYFTNMLVKIPFVIFMTLLALFVVLKLAPDNGNIPQLAVSNQDKTKRGERAGLDNKQQRLAKLIFVGTIIGIVVCAALKISTWYPSLIGAMLMILTGILSDREGIHAMGSPVIFITVGTLPMATALSKTGTDQLIADAFSKVTGNMSPIMIMISMYLICMVLTQFLTNSAVSNIFKMLAAVIAIQNGFNPTALMLAANQGAGNSDLLPTATPIGSMVYDAGGYSMKQYFKQGIPSSIAKFIIFILWVPILYPLV